MLRDSAQQSGEVDYDIVEVDAPAHPMNKMLLAYWWSKMGPDGIVRRGDIAPTDVRQALGGVFIVEPVEGGRDLLYRLVGSANELRLGFKCTGRRFTECYGPRMAADQIAFHNRVFASGKPAFLRGRLIGLDIEHADFEACYLPMKTDDGLDQIIGGMFDMAE
jgi:hypothetical protein